MRKLDYYTCELKLVAGLKIIVNYGRVLFTSSFLFIFFFISRSRKCVRISRVPKQKNVCQIVFNTINLYFSNIIIMLIILTKLKSLIY